MSDKNFSRWAWLLAAATLLAGYADLVRGGISVSAILLSLGYCVFVPAAIMGRGGRASPADRGTRRAALLMAAAVFLLYVLTLAPSTAMWDASEYIAAAWTFGLPHPPGNPMFVILGRTAALLPIGPTVATRINLLAALASAVSAGVWFLVASRATRHWSTSSRVSHAVGAVSALLGATAFTVWNQSVVNEKVYTVALVGLALSTWLMVRWLDDPDRPGAGRALVLVAYLAGLGYANHMAGLLALPAAGVAVLLHRPRTLLRWRLVLACLGAGVLGVTPFATQPIRAAHQPALNEGEPTACRAGFAWSCTLSRGTWRAFTYNLNREQYGKPSLAVRQAPFTAQVGMWWLYFKWQWFRDGAERAPALQGVLAALFLVLGLVGAREQLVADRRGFLVFAPLVVTLTVVLIWYLNFRYGASQAPALEVPREVRDRDYFYLWSFSTWGVWAALGLAAAWRWLAGEAPSRRRLLVVAPVLGIGALPLGLNWKDASRAGDFTTIAFARDLLNSVEPHAILITGGDNDTFPLWYAQQVEGIRRDVTVGVLSLMNTDWFVRGLARRPMTAWDSTRGPAVYRDRAWPVPDGPPLRLSLAEVDALPELQPVQQQVRFQHGAIAAVIDPSRLLQVQGIPVLERADLVMFRMIADNVPQRPVYISRTTGDYAERMGLGPFTISQGLARKVVAPPTPGDGIVMVDGSGWLDVSRSLALWKEFTGPDALVARGRWIDRPSVSTAFAYLLAGSELAEGVRIAGGDAAPLTNDVTRVARAVGLAHLLQPAAASPGVGGDTAR